MDIFLIGFLIGLAAALLAATAARLFLAYWLRVATEARQRERLRQMANGGDADMIPWARVLDEKRRQ